MEKEKYVSLAIIGLDEISTFRLPTHINSKRMETTNNVESPLYYGFREVDFPHVVLANSPRLSFYNPEYFPDSIEMRENGRVCLPDCILSLISNPERVALLEYSNHLRLANLETFKEYRELKKD